MKRDSLIWKIIGLALAVAAAAAGVYMFVCWLKKKSLCLCGADNDVTLDCDGVCEGCEVRDNCAGNMADIPCEE